MLRCCNEKKWQEDDILWIMKVNLLIELHRTFFDSFCHVFDYFFKHYSPHAGYALPEVQEKADQAIYQFRQFVRHG